MNHLKRMRSCIPGVYGITSDHILHHDELLLKHVEASLKAGVKLLQYRNKNISHLKNRLLQIKKLLQLCNDYHVPLIINDNVMLAKESGAHGVHLGMSDGSLLAARKLLGAKAIIGATCHNSVDRALIAQEQQASYIAFGRFFSSLNKPNAPLAKLSTLSEAKKKCHIPIVAIGGINTDNCKYVIKAGSDMVAVIEALYSPQHNRIKERMKQFDKKFNDFYVQR